MNKGTICLLITLALSTSHAQESSIKAENLAPASTQAGNAEISKAEATDQPAVADSVNNATPAVATNPTVTNSETAQIKSTSKIKELLKNKKFEEDTDITDAKLKAEGGSLSKYSFKFNLSYYGPPASDLESSKQPNPDNNKKANDVALSGSIGGKYRVDSERSYAAGSGLKAVDPMHGTSRYDINDPFIAYSVFSRVDGMQMSHYFKVAYVTTPNYTSLGEDGSLSYDNWLVYDLGTSKFALEFDTGFGYYLYDRGPKLTGNAKKDKYELAANRYSVSFIPILKYRFSGKLNLETSVSFTYTNYRITNDHTLWNQSMSTQRLGLGYAYTRDVYINPYISFYPSQFSPENTSINISTTFSLL